MPNLRGHLTGLLVGVIGLGQFHRWSWDKTADIEQRGSDDDIALLNLVLNRFAEYTGGYIDAPQFVDALRTDPLVQKELAARRIAVA